MHAAPMEDLERLERDVQELRAAIVDLLEVSLITKDPGDLAAAVQLTLETLKERTRFQPDFEMGWEVGMDREIRFEEDGE